MCLILFFTQHTKKWLQVFFLFFKKELKKRNTDMTNFNRLHKNTSRMRAHTFLKPGETYPLVDRLPTFPRQELRPFCHSRRKSSQRFCGGKRRNKEATLRSFKTKLRNVALFLHHLRVLFLHVNSAEIRHSLFH